MTKYININCNKIIVKWIIYLKWNENVSRIALYQIKSWICVKSENMQVDPIREIAAGKMDWIRVRKELNFTKLYCRKLVNVYNSQENNSEKLDFFSNSEQKSDRR